MEQIELICIGCPLGCNLTAQLEEGKVISVQGNTCLKGEAYARKELTHPTRIVTTTVRVQGGEIEMVSVKTKEDIPKGKIFECVNALKEVQVVAPVQIGDVILENVAGTGVPVVATKEVRRKGLLRAPTRISM